MKNFIRVGNIDLSFHDAASRAVEDVLINHDHKVKRLSAHHEEAFRMLGDGEIDMLCAAWLPDSHEIYLKPMIDDVEKLTVLYEPYCIWGVPNYISEEDISEVSDLLKPEVADKMKRLIQGINPGAGISRFSKAMIEAYGLKEMGYHFEPGTEDECFGRFIEAHSDEKWIVIPLWHPQWLHNRYKIRALKEPKGLLGSKDEATLVVRKDAKNRIHSAAISELRTLHLGNAKVSELDDMIQKENNA